MQIFQFKKANEVQEIARSSGSGKVKQVPIKKNRILQMCAISLPKTNASSVRSAGKITQKFGTGSRSMASKNSITINKKAS